jgi:hypothetical protein
MKTLPAGETDETARKTFSQRLSDRDKSCGYAVRPVEVTDIARCPPRAWLAMNDQSSCRAQ